MTRVAAPSRPAPCLPALGLFIGSGPHPACPSTSRPPPHSPESTGSPSPAPAPGPRRQGRAPHLLAPASPGPTPSFRLARPAALPPGKPLHPLRTRPAARCTRLPPPDTLTLSFSALATTPTISTNHRSRSPAYPGVSKRRPPLGRPPAPAFAGSSGLPALAGTPGPA